MQNEQLERKSILEMSSGAILERVDYEMGRIMENIMDPNTKPGAKRKLTLTVELTPSADRKTITVQTTAKATLCPTDAVTTALAVVGAPGTGEISAVEMTPQIPGQYYMDGSIQDQPSILKFTKQA